MSRLPTLTLASLCLCLLSSLEATTAQADIAQQSEVRQFIREMNQKHRFDTDSLEHLFKQVSIQDAILTAMSRPYEAKPWYEYRKLFLTEKRIAAGQNFMRQNSTALAQAERKYGVPASVMTAIIGIETSYGENPGKYRVVDALSTLAFAYPKRASFFRRELEEYLILCREEKISPDQPIGSYAGAMGLPQFMPSSYRGYAVDGNGDGKRDIWHDPADAIASVGNYLARNGWQAEGSVAVAAHLTHPHTRLSGKTLKAEYTVNQLRTEGVEAAQAIPGHWRGNLIELEEAEGPAYWIGFNNFYTITRYNHSALYAMAAHQLSQVVQSHTAP